MHAGPPLAIGFGLAQPNGPAKSGARPNSLCRQELTPQGTLATPRPNPAMTDDVVVGDDV
jgi:hypothetical protein